MTAAALSRKRPERAECYEEKEFVVYPKVAVFKENSRRLPKDKKNPDADPGTIEFDDDAMEAIAENCNRRIEDTGDFVPIVLRHNPLTHAGDDRKVVGFAGPFWTGKFGRKTPLMAIFAELRIFKRDKEETEKYPRLSVECWLQKNGDPTTGVIDPVCLLGSETPELDLGLRYARSVDHPDQQRFHYQMAMPTSPESGNTFVPGTSGRDKRMDYEAGGIGADGGTGNNQDFHPSTHAGSLSQGDIDQIANAMSELVRLQVQEETADLRDQLAQLQKQLGLNPLTGENAALEQSGNPDDMGEPPVPAEGMAPTAPGNMPPSGDGQGPAGGGKNSSPGDGFNDSKDQATGDKPDSDSDDDKDKKKPMSFSKSAAAGEAADPLAQLQSQLATEQAEKNALLDKIKKMETKQRTALRFSKLESCVAEGIIVDPQEEMKHLADASDEFFDRHVGIVKLHYQRGEASLPGLRTAAGSVRLQYSKLDDGQRQDFRKQAQKLQGEQQKKNPNASYRAALAQVCADNSVDCDIK